MDKNLARQSIKKLRSEMQKSDVLEKSRIICQKALNISEIKNAKNILAYSDFKNEVCTKYLCDELLKQGKNVYLPVVTGDDIIIGSYNCDEFKTSNFGIKEPCVLCDCTDKSSIDLCIVPGVVFDEQLQRAGFGRGYYDRFFSQNKKCAKVALAYDFQVIKKLDCEKHDVPMDIIITEKRILRG